MSTEPGLLWRIWTENAAEQNAGDIHLVADELSAVAYADMHTKRLESFGVTGIRVKVLRRNVAFAAEWRVLLMHRGGRVSS